MSFTAYINTLFDQHEFIHLGDNYFKPRTDRVIAGLAEIAKAKLAASFDGNYVSINPTDSHGNTIFRNLLFEIDAEVWTVERQVAFYKKRKLPFTSMVYTGGKSVHVIISLSQPVKDAAAYRRLHYAIWSALWGIPDRSSDPYKTTKYPGGHRLKGNEKREQTLIELRDRVSLEDLRKFLSSNNCLHYLKELPRTERKTIPKVVGYAIAEAGDNHSQVYVECPVCGSSGKLAVHLESGKFRCFKECLPRDICNAIDDNYGVGIEIESIRTERERENKTFHLWMDH
jgi:hypothetical protein